MSNSDISRTGRRRLRTAAALALPPLTALLFFATPPAPLAASALSPAAKPPPPPPPTCLIGCPPTQNPSPSPCFSNDFFTDCSPSPSPAIIVISPVPLDLPSRAVTPSYLIGIPSPSVDPGVDTGGTPIPLGGGFKDLPSPAPVAAVPDTGNGGGGGPGPWLLIGLLLLVGAVGSVLWAIAPKGERFPEQPAREAPGLVFTPYGADSPELMVMDQGPEPSPQSRARRPRPSA
jgi:hypothetical protein